jgi:hypothetical protein
MYSKNISLRYAFENTLLDAVNDYFISNKTKMRIFLDRIENYKRGEYKCSIFRYLIRPDINSPYKIGFKVLVYIQKPFYPNFEKSLSITVTLHSIIDYRTGEEFTDIPRNYKQIVEQVCSNDEAKCLRLFKRIYEYMRMLMEAIITMLELENYKTYLN